MNARSFWLPWGSLAIGRAPVCACGADAGQPDVIPSSWGQDYCGDLVIHQGHKASPDLAMKWDASVHDQFPHGALVGVVHVREVTPPGARLSSRWAEDGRWHWHISRPRPFAVPIPWRGAQGLFTVYGREVREAIEAAEIAALRASEARWAALPEDFREDIDERQAIMEFDGQSAPQAAASESFRTAQYRAAIRAARPPGRPYGAHRRLMDATTRNRMPAWAQS